MVFDILSRGVKSRSTSYNIAQNAHNNQAFIVPIGSTDEWEDRDNQIAIKINGGFNYITAGNGMALTVADEQTYVYFEQNNNQWTKHTHISTPTQRPDYIATQVAPFVPIQFPRITTDTTLPYSVSTDRRILKIYSNFQNIIFYGEPLFDVDFLFNFDIELYFPGISTVFENLEGIYLGDFYIINLATISPFSIGDGSIEIFTRDTSRDTGAGILPSYIHDASQRESLTYQSTFSLPVGHMVKYRVTPRGVIRFNDPLNVYGIYGNSNAHVVE